MSTLENQGEIIQYVPFTSFVHPSFWHSLTDMKLDVDRLQETTKQIFGRFTYRADIGAIFEVDGTSFNVSPELEQFYTNVKGTIMNKNTIEEFKNIDKASLLNSLGEIIWANLKQKRWIDNPSTLLNFFILSFADLKKFHYYYWFAYPAPSQPTVYLKEKSTILKSHFNNKEIEQLTECYNALDISQKCFFALTKDNDTVCIDTLRKVFDNELSNVDVSKIYFVFNDPSNGDNPGWPLRTFIAVLLDHYPRLAGSQVNFIGLRCDLKGGLEHSRIFIVHVPQNIQKVVSAGWVGWERNIKGNFGPKLTNMSASMDPVKLADTASDLNIKLMKWRLVPDIDINVMKSVKCLLLGAGTLGCHVARGLLAWGFRHITFVDNGKVSFSNPSRQVLFNFQDCLSGGRNKAEAAADNLKAILPTVNAKGIAAHIPMPGHPVGESLKEETIHNVKILTDAIADHDVIFLLLDTREARWLPTLLAAYHGKIVINAALGFDSYLVMRHGVADKLHDCGTSQDGSISENGGTLQDGSISQNGGTLQDGGTPRDGCTTSVNISWIPGGELGCYFCNDVTAPGNSIKDRTLDQQCTVTRPGVAAIAGALAVEVLVALLQHPLRIHAPAVYNLSDGIENGLPAELQGVLGPVPHSIRGFLHSYQTVVPTCAKFRQCIACSDIVINKYKEQGLAFVLNVLNSGNYLEEVTGLSELHLAAEMSDILTFSDED